MMKRGIILLMLVSLFALFNQTYGQKLCRYGVQLIPDCGNDTSVCRGEIAKKYGVTPVDCYCQVNPIKMAFCQCDAICPPPLKEKKILSL
ncbi:unnamed protein product [Lathyrus oleraceus]